MYKSRGRCKSWAHSNVKVWKTDSLGQPAFCHETHITSWIPSMPSQFWSIIKKLNEGNRPWLKPPLSWNVSTASPHPVQRQTDPVTDSKQSVSFRTNPVKLFTQSLLGEQACSVLTSLAAGSIDRVAAQVQSKNAEKWHLKISSASY